MTEYEHPRKSLWRAYRAENSGLTGNGRPYSEWLLEGVLIQLMSQQHADVATALHLEAGLAEHLRHEREAALGE